MKDKLRSMLTEHGFVWPANAVEQLANFFQLLAEANEHFNLTTLMGHDDFLYKHILDSLLPTKFFSAQGSLVDVGTGAGFPGIPIKIVYGDSIELFLVEASVKKAMFLEHCCRALDLQATVLNARAEDLGRSSYREFFDIAIARAVASLPVLSEYCLPLVRCGGIFVACKGPGGPGEAAQARVALDCLGGEVSSVFEYSLPAGDKRSLILVTKKGACPERYPRRAGIPAKRPLE